MQNIMKPLLSFFAIGLFLLITLATFQLSKESTNETVAIKECKEKPPVHGKLHIEIKYEPEVRGIIFITQQKVRHDTTCTFDVITNYRHTFNFDVQGRYVFDDDSEWTHDNSEDLFRIEVGALSYIHHERMYMNVKPKS